MRQEKKKQKGGEKKNLALFFFTQPGQEFSAQPGEGRRNRGGKSDEMFSPEKD